MEAARREHPQHPHFEQILGITEEQLSLSTSIAYTKDVDEGAGKGTVRGDAGGPSFSTLLLSMTSSPSRKTTRRCPEVHSLLPETGVRARLYPMDLIFTRSSRADPPAGSNSWQDHRAGDTHPQ